MWKTKVIGHYNSHTVNICIKVTYFVLYFYIFLNVLLLMYLLAEPLYDFLFPALGSFSALHHWCNFHFLIGKGHSRDCVVSTECSLPNLIF